MGELTIIELDATTKPTAISREGMTVPEMGTTLAYIETPPGAIEEVYRWIVRLSEMFDTKLVGLPPGTTSLPLLWYIREEQGHLVWSAMNWRGVEKDCDAELSDSYFAFNGVDHQVQSLTIRQGKPPSRGKGMNWLGVSVELLQQKLREAPPKVKYRFGEFSTLIRRIQERAIIKEGT